MLETVEKTIAQHHLFTSATPVIIMVSGGSDSTALAYIMKDLMGRGLVGSVAILHVNHKIRGDEADGDQLFVRNLAQTLDLPCFECEIDIPLLVEQTGGNEEALARHERYLAAHEALESLCCHVAVPICEGRIVTAHTQDDRVENFYMRSIKGTGPGGFRSMLYVNGPVVRPLLDVSREDLRNYLQSIDGPYRDEEGHLWHEDATNAHTDRFRAFVRHEIIPLAKSRNARLLDTLCRSMNLIADEDDYLASLAKKLYEKHLEWINGAEMEFGESPEGCLIAAGFGKEARPLQRRVILAVLETFIGKESRVETASIEAVLDAFDEGGLPKSGYVVNIQGNLAVSSNKHGVRVEPMARFRARRKRVK